MPWLLGRILTALALVWVVVTVVFLGLHMVPGDPAELLLSVDSGIVPDPAAVEALRRSLGLDLPLTEQYWAFLAGLARGNLGQSVLDGYPVFDEILLRLPRTIELILVAATIALAGGVTAGIAGAVRQRGAFDRTALAVASALQATPVFVLGTVAVYVFAQSLRLVPAGGYVPFLENPVRHISLLLLPAVTTSARLMADMFRMTRASVLEVLSSDFVRTARAKGVAPRAILVRHVLRAALVPVVTLIGMDMGTLLGGTVLVEYVFNWPGLSAPLMRSIGARDYPMVAGIVLITSALFLALNVATDVLNAVIDPRAKAR